MRELKQCKNQYNRIDVQIEIFALGYSAGNNRTRKTALVKIGEPSALMTVIATFKAFAIATISGSPPQSGPYSMPLQYSCTENNEGGDYKARFKIPHRLIKS
jgi:hypothetical protein